MTNDTKIGRLLFEKTTIMYSKAEKGFWNSEAYLAKTPEGYKYTIEFVAYTLIIKDSKTGKHETISPSGWVACFYDGKRYLDFAYANSSIGAMEKCSLHYEKRLTSFR